MRTKKKTCPNCNGKLLKFFPKVKYLREGDRICYEDPITDKEFFYGCIKCPYAKYGGVYNANSHLHRK
ncbi:hypothetical protein HYU23_03040 [Candidatus Woesearchaeota archaeon]|nr:hypothetical protein [Candidatus Woesearchaeota archaeon]